MRLNARILTCFISVISTLVACQQWNVTDKVIKPEPVPPSGPSWVKVSDHPSGERSECAVFVIQDRAYIIGGVFGPEQFTNEMWEYKTTTKTWTRKASPLATPTAYGVGFSNGTQGFYTTYYDGKNTGTSLATNSLYSYDPAADKWSNPVFNTIWQRTFCQACVVGTIAYIGMGSRPASPTSIQQSEVIRYNMATGTADRLPLSSLAASLSGRILPVMMPYGTKCIIGGGTQVIQPNNEPTFPISAYEYDPASNAYDGRATLPEARITSGASIGGTRPFVITVNNSNLYEYKGGRWDKVTLAFSSPIPSSRGGAVLFAVGNTLYYGLGFNQANSLIRFKDLWAITL